MKKCIIPMTTTIDNNNLIHTYLIPFIQNVDFSECDNPMQIKAIICKLITVALKSCKNNNDPLDISVLDSIELSPASIMQTDKVVKTEVVKTDKVVKTEVVKTEVVKTDKVVKTDNSVKTDKVVKIEVVKTDNSENIVLELNVLDILNKQIRTRYNPEIFKQLNDYSLYEYYMKSESVKNKITILTKYLKKANIDEEQINNIISNKDFCLEFLVTPGLKGVIKGNFFNKIVKDKILSFAFLNQDYDIAFEKNCNNFDTDEIPDFYITNIKTKKSLVGMNQISLTGGGHQTNRAYKYLSNVSENVDNKLICIIAEFPELIKKTSSKNYKIFSKGFEKDILFYVSDLEDYIIKFFKTQ